ncbi:tetratricopeptide repeat protein [Treponema parvum]|uniref:Tetratricopeptide repeat protein n=1 Tax=Treponema parvum TaxID=138851 RepID=A0A975ID40_9SPIR|nr:tetratricopeptide repeat protein [Treponema parvum]QTQ12373.1 tetratricopeptide repeat protein [Treponema parvum]
MSNTEVILKRADNATRARDFSLAIRLYESLLSKRPDSNTIMFKLGSTYVKSGDDEKALPYYQKIIAIDPNNFNALVDLGGIYRRMKRFEDSLSVLQKAEKINKSDPQINYNFGFTYKFMGEYEKALSYFRAAIEENPNDVLAYNHMGVIYALRNDHVAAVSIYRRGLKIDPNHPVLNLNLAESFEALKQNDNAAAAYKAALRARPGWQEAIEKYAKLLLRTKHRKTTERMLSQTLDFDSKNVNLHILMGRCLSSQSDYRAALDSYNKALEIDAGSKKAVLGAALMNEKLGVKARSVELMQQLESAEPDDIDIKEKYAHVLLSAEHFEAALKRINTVLKAYPQRLQALNLLGQYYLCVGNDGKAEETYSEIESLNPSYVDYLRDASLRCQQIGNITKARRYIDRYLKIKPTEPAGLLIAAAISEISDPASTALACYHKVLKYDRYNAIALEAVKRLGEKVTEENLRKAEEEKEMEEIDFEDDIPAVSMDIDESLFENSYKDKNGGGFGSEEFDFDAWGAEHPVIAKDEDLEFADDEDIEDDEKPIGLKDLVDDGGPVEPDRKPQRRRGPFDEPSGGKSGFEMEDIEDDDILGLGKPSSPQTLPETASDRPLSHGASENPANADEPEEDFGGFTDDDYEKDEAGGKKTDSGNDSDAEGSEDFDRLAQEASEEAIKAAAEAKRSAEEAQEAAQAAQEAADSVKNAQDEDIPAEFHEADDGSDYDETVDEDAETLDGDLLPAEGNFDDVPASADEETAFLPEDAVSEPDEEAADEEIGSLTDEDTETLAEDAEEEPWTEESVPEELPEELEEPSLSEEDAELPVVSEEALGDEDAETLAEDDVALSDEKDIGADDAEIADAAADEDTEFIPPEDLIADDEEPSDSDIIYDDMEKPAGGDDLEYTEDDDLLSVDDSAELPAVSDGDAENSFENEEETGSLTDEDAETLADDVLTDEEPVPEEDAELPAASDENFDAEEEPSTEELAPEELSEELEEPPLPEDGFDDVPVVSEDSCTDETAENKAELLKLFQRLQTLSSSLPPEKKSVFLESTDRVRMDYVVSKLEGRQGLLAAAQEIRGADPALEQSAEESQDSELSGDGLTSAVLDIMTKMSGELTDKTLAAALSAILKEAKEGLN